jgi:trimethylamine--corrinoid protein Co-methyltransferase
MLMVNGYAQVGKFLDLPTHAYLVATDAKLIDAQAGMESASSAVHGVLSGINMISGAGMLDFLACHSLEKLVIDAEDIANAKRFLQGITLHSDSLALEHYKDFEFPGDFLAHKLTRQLYRGEQYFPSPVIDRGSLRSWKEKGSNDIFIRTKIRAKEILSIYHPPDIPPEIERALYQLVSTLARKAGMDNLPEITHR